MEEYLLEHNIRMSDFIFIVGWLAIILVFLTFIWVITIQNYKLEKKFHMKHCFWFWIGDILLSIILVPIAVRCIIFLL